MTNVSENERELMASVRVLGKGFVIRLGQKCDVWMKWAIPRITTPGIIVPDPCPSLSLL